jgi:hypothetical protein
VTDEETSQTDTAEMKNLNEKRKTESGIRMFNECDSTVWELRNPEDIGVAGMNMHLARFAYGKVLFLGCASWESNG